MESKNKVAAIKSVLQDIVDKIECLETDGERGSLSEYDCFKLYYYRILKDVISGYIAALLI